MTDGTKAVVWDRQARPFGETISLSGTADLPLRFPGQYYDSETGLHYNYFRDYDPSTGRYVQSDPTGLLGGLNTYVYVLDNPIRLTDPLGLQTKPIPVPRAECPKIDGYSLVGASIEFLPPLAVGGPMRCIAICKYEKSDKCGDGPEEYEFPGTCHATDQLPA